MDIFWCSKAFLLGEEIIFRRDLGETNGIECIGLFLALNRIAIILYSYDFISKEIKCSFEGVSQDENWKPEFRGEVILNKDILVSPSVPEMAYISDFCIERFNLPISFDIFELVRNELYPSKVVS